MLQLDIRDGPTPEGAQRAHPARVLLVDDDDDLIQYLEHLVTLFGYEPICARSGGEALARLGPEVDLVVLDVLMPRMDGYETARRIRAHPEHGRVPILMVTCHAGDKERLLAVDAGANDFVSKPLDSTELRVRMRALLKAREAEEAARRAIEEAALETVLRLSIAAEYLQEETSAHVRRVGLFSKAIALAMGQPGAYASRLEVAATLHDVGKLGVSHVVLRQTGRYTPEEFEEMKRHTVIGATILAGSPSPVLQMGEEVAATHHERWDGSGYPSGLRCEEIPLSGRIVALADVFDALSTPSFHRPALSAPQARAIVRAGAGGLFDPAVVEAFFAAFEEIRAIQERLPD